MDDLSFFCPEEITQVFRNYRNALKLTSFKTPLQRALALSNQQRFLKLEHMRQLQQEHVTSLLPQGANTRVCVDVMYLLATSPKTWKLRVPNTLLSRAECLALIRTDGHGKVLVNRVNEARAVRAFVNGLGQNGAAYAQGLPKFVHKCASSQQRLLFSLSDLEETWRNHSLEVQQIQEFLVPAHGTVSLTRVHWKNFSHKGIYYLLHRKQEDRKTSHVRLKSLADITGIVRQPDDFVINAKAANVISVKRSKPDPQLDSMLEEVAKLLEYSLCKDHERIDEIVCDFVQDWKGQPVLLSCEGYTFKALKSAITRKMMPELTGQTLVTDEDESVQEKQIIRSRSVSPKRKSNLSPMLPQVFLLKQPSLKPDFRRTQFHLTSITNSYDSMLSKVKTYKEELKTAINFVDKYGGSAFWRPILHTISDVFRADQKLKMYYEHLNFEEGSMLQRGYQRILEGNYNLYYKKSMTNVHMGKGIDIAAFQAFVANVEVALDGYPIAMEDVKTIIQRFRTFEACICPKD